MHERLCRGHARGYAFGIMRASIQRVRRGRKPCLPRLRARGIRVAVQRAPHAQAIHARRRAIDARPAAPGKGVPIGRFIARGQGGHGLPEEGGQLREHIAKQARDAQGDIKARAVKFGNGQDFHTRYARRAIIPDRPRAQKVQRHGEFFACGAHGGTAP
jgi:hypothetical protein